MQNYLLALPYPFCVFKTKKRAYMSIASSLLFVCCYIFEIKYVD